MAGPYDGKPYYCVTCDAPLDASCKDGCVPESEATAKLRQQRRKPKSSDLANARAMSADD